MGNCPKCLPLSLARVLTKTPSMRNTSASRHGAAAPLGKPTPALRSSLTIASAEYATAARPHINLIGRIRAAGGGTVVLGNGPDSREAVNTYRSVEYASGRPLPTNPELELVVSVVSVVRIVWLGRGVRLGRNRWFCRNSNRSHSYQTRSRTRRPNI